MSWRRFELWLFRLLLSRLIGVWKRQRDATLRSFWEIVRTGGSDARREYWSGRLSVYRSVLADLGVRNDEDHGPP